MLVAAALVVELFVARFSGIRFLFLAFSPAVAVSAWYGGFGPGSLAVLLAALSTDYFLLGSGTFAGFDNRGEAAALTVFVAGWLGVCLVVHFAYREMQRERVNLATARRAAAQAERLAQLTSALGRARSQGAVVEACVQESLHSLRADAGMFLLVGEDGRSATVTRAVAYPSSRVVEKQVLPLGHSPVSDAIQRRAPVVVDSRKTRDAEYPDAGGLDEFDAVVVTPLVVGGRVVAAVRLDFARDHAFTSDDREFLFSLGTHGAQALERTWEHEAAQRARVEAESLRARADQELAERHKTEQALRASETRYRALATRTTRLHGLTAALSEAVTVDAVAKAVVQQGTVVVGATAGSVSLVEEQGAELRSIYAEAYGRPVSNPHVLLREAGDCAIDAIESRRPLFIGSWEERQEQYWRSAALAADAAYVSSAVLPLVVEGTAIGVLRFDFSVPVNFDDEYRALLVSVAQHCTQAIDRARLYESAQNARAQAEAANRLKDDFLSIVSHELRTPLNAVLGWASTLQRGTADPDIRMRAVQSISENAMRQAKLIDDLLDVSRIVAGRTTLDLQDINVAELIAGVVESFIPVAASNSVDLHLSAVPSCIVVGDLRRLEQVFFNLLSNALKFTPAGGRIDIVGHLRDAGVEIEVSDTGIGIEPEFLPHVFERFRQADSRTTRNHGGLGLGLSIAKQLVEAHSGSIGVRSDGQNRGTTFTVQLPVGSTPPDRLKPAAEDPRSRAVVGPAAPRLDGIRILAVDDDPAARELLAYTLGERGARVRVAASAAEAVDVLGKTEFDVLLADIAMPEEDGCSLMRRVRASGSRRVASMPAAAVTAHAREEERREVLAAGFDVHLVKPIDPPELARVVLELARRRIGSSVQNIT